jgi:glycosyltransferase involved in cell wall biosynthesis
MLMQDRPKQRRLKVLLVTGWYPHRQNEVEGTFVRDQAQAIRPFCDVTVLHLAGVRSGMDHFWDLCRESDDILSLGIPTFRMFHRDMRGRAGRNASFVASSLFAIARVSKGWRPDLIHAHVYRAGFPAVLAAKAMRVPSLITEHSTSFGRGVLGHVSSQSARLAFAMADRVVTVSDALQSTLVRSGIRGRFITIPNAVDTSVFHPDIDRPSHTGIQRLLVVCLLDSSHKKGIPILLQALARLKDLRADWHLDLVGDGPARAEYEALAVRLGLSPHVSFLGSRPKSDIAARLRQASLLVVASLYETFSVVAAEALASGVPVVSTRCGGPEEFVTPEVGSLCPPGDARALCDTLDLTLSRLHTYSPTYIAEYARSRFSFETVGAKLHGLYGELVAQTRRY